MKTTEASQTRSVTAVVWSGAPVQHQHQAGTATGEGAEGGVGWQSRVASPQGLVNLLITQLYTVCKVEAGKASGTDDSERAEREQR